MVCLGLEPGAAGWKAQTNPLSYGGTPRNLLFKMPFRWDKLGKTSDILGSFVVPARRYALAHTWIKLIRISN